MTSSQEPTFSMRLVRPFLLVLQEKGMPVRAIQHMGKGDADARISAATALDMLDRVVQFTGDPAIGLRAALHTTDGSYDALEYAAASCATIGDALELVRRSYRLISDSSELAIRRRAGQVELVLRPSVPMPRPATDFAMGASYLFYTRCCGDRPSTWQVWFGYPKPADLTMHEKLFGGLERVRFDCAFDGYVFDEAQLDLAPPRSDVRLNRVLRDSLRAQLRELPDVESVTQRARRMILEELPSGDPSAAHVALRLGVSRRTLTRMLEDEGTSFKVLLGDVRCAMALHYLVTENLAIPEIVRRLGYSEPAAFHKAFKRWFGLAPLEYRRSFRSSRPGGPDTCLRALAPLTESEGRPAVRDR